MANKHSTSLHQSNWESHKPELNGLPAWLKFAGSYVRPTRYMKNPTVFPQKSKSTFCDCYTDCLYWTEAGSIVDVQDYEGRFESLALRTWLLVVLWLSVFRGASSSEAKNCGQNRDLHNRICPRRLVWRSNKLGTRKQCVKVPGFIYPCGANQRAAAEISFRISVPKVVFSFLRAQNKQTRRGNLFIGPFRDYWRKIFSSMCFCARLFCVFFLQVGFYDLGWSLWSLALINVV